MTRISIILSSVAAIVIGTSTAIAGSQLSASAGLTPAEAEGLTLSQIAQHKANRGVSYSDQHVVDIPEAYGRTDRTQLAARAGVTPEQADAMTLNELAVAKYNSEQNQDDAQGVIVRSGATVTSRSANRVSPQHAQLVASAGLSQEEAANMSLDEIAWHKLNKGESLQDAR